MKGLVSIIDIRPHTSQKVGKIRVVTIQIGFLLV
jgi:hypothetical protein